MILLYNALLLAGLLITSPWWLFRLITNGKYREGLRARLGSVPQKFARGADGCVWVHAVSVGEVMAAAPLVRALRDRLEPATRVLVSTTTATGQRVARNQFGAENVFYFPLDFPWAVRRFLRALKPQLLVLMESELWPNILTQAARSGARVAVVNARISDRSYARYCRLRWFWEPILSTVNIFFAQSELDARRLRAIGIPPNRLHTIGNLKFDVPPPPQSEIADLLRRYLPENAPVLICGSTLEGEEHEILHARAQVSGFAPRTVTILAPRHLERFDAVARKLPPGSLRRSEWGHHPGPIPPGAIFLLDSVGELASVYAVGTVALVGGSLVQAGGHNPLEPAAAGLPILCGMSMFNFREISNVLETCGALTRVIPADLPDQLVRLLTHPDQAAEQGRRGQRALAENSGATQRAVQALVGLLAENPA